MFFSLVSWQLLYEIVSCPYGKPSFEHIHCMVCEQPVPKEELKCLLNTHFESLILFKELCQQQPLCKILRFVVSGFLICALLTFARKQLLLLI